MINRIIYLVLAILLLLFVFSSCRDTESINVNPTNNGSNYSKNLPVTGNVPNSFSFVVDASVFNYSETQSVQISSDSLSIGITVTNFVSGNGKIIVKDNSGASIYEKNLSGGMVSGEVLQLNAVPNTVTLQLNNYTGKVVIGLAGK